MFLTWPLKKFGSLDDRKPNMVRNPRWLQHMNNHWMVPYTAGEAIFIQVLLVTQQRIYW
jgi:hypothetical protein